MSKGLSKLEKAVDLEGKELVDASKKNYQAMGRQWWEFAKNIALIGKKEAFKAVGYDSFKAFCEEEYPSVAYVTLVKYTHIVDEFYEVIEKKIANEDKYKLPAMESFYLLVSSKDALDKDNKSEEYSKLKKLLVDGKLPYMKAIEEIKGMKAKLLPAKTDPKELEEELTKDIEEELEDSDDEIETDDGAEFDADDIDSIADTDEGVAAMLKSALQKVEATSDYIVSITAEIKKADIDNPDVQLLADALSDLDQKCNKFYNKLEKLEG